MYHKCNDHLSLYINDHKCTWPLATDMQQVAVVGELQASNADKVNDSPFKSLRIPGFFSKTIKQMCRPSPQPTQWYQKGSKTLCEKKEI